MIVKENTNPIPENKLDKAGYDAERKIAYYLKMAFEDEPRLLILHDLRIELGDGITAQIDHFIIHQFGLIIIESKSVAGELRVNEHGEWLRVFYNSATKWRHENGLGNPIKQAQNQGKTLRKMLLESSKEATREMLEKFPIDVLVAISDGGKFVGDRSLYPEVCKADQVDDRIKLIVKNRSESFKNGDFKLSDINKDKLAKHLISKHKPYEPKPEATAEKTVRIGFTHDTPNKPEVTPPKAEKTTSVKKVSIYKKIDTSKLSIREKLILSLNSTTKSYYENICTKCNSHRLEIRYGIRYGKNYYFKCLVCDENYPIDISCSQCNRQLKVRKEKDKFFVECKSCNNSELLHVNL